MISLMWSCFKGIQGSSTTSAWSTAVVGDDKKAEISCIFCNVSKESGFDILWEDESFVVIRDHKPAAVHHLQVIPKRHIDSVKSLLRKDTPMVERMARLGHQMLDDLGVPNELRRLGFHIPPFCSVSHLHMHVQGLPYRSLHVGFVRPVRQYAY